MEHLPQRAKEDLQAGAPLSALGWGDRSASRSVRRARVYQAREGFCWSSGGTKGISRSPEQVAVWVNSFSLNAHLDIAMGDMYNEAEATQ